MILLRPLLVILIVIKLLRRLLAASGATYHTARCLCLAVCVFVVGVELVGVSASVRFPLRSCPRLFAPLHSLAHRGV
jgi:hypothetical protein